MINLGIFADKPMASTGMAIVNHNIAYQLSHNWGEEIRPIYFGRFGTDKGVADFSSPFHGYEYVRCEGGVWKAKTVAEAALKYKLDVIYSEDDWFSMEGLVNAAKFVKKPLYFLTPIDGLPIQYEALRLFKQCRKVFVPNRSYVHVLNGAFLPHTVDWEAFRPCTPKMKDFTFLWIGRAEERKNPLSVIKAFKKVYKKYDCRLVMRSGWGESELCNRMNLYLNKYRIPVIKSRMSDIPHERMAEIYSPCHAYINTSKAGGCEMSIMEANACGLPTLSTDWNFMNENVIDGVTGFNIPIESFDIQPQRTQKGIIAGTSGRMWGNISVDALTEKMMWMLENQREAAQMGVDGLLHVRENSWTKVTENFVNIILDDYETLNSKEKK